MGKIITAAEKKVYEEKAELLKALAHPVRLCIVKKLYETGGSNVSSMQNCFLMPQSTVSQHLSKLKSLGIVEGKRHGTEIVYRVINTDAIKIVDLLLSIGKKHLAKCSILS